MKTQEKTGRRGRPARGTHYAQRFKEHLDTLPYSESAVFIANLMLRLEVSADDIKRFTLSEVYHTAPNRAAIIEIAGKDIYQNKR